MNEDLKNKLILLGVIFVGIVLLYYIMSPYQKCYRAMMERGGMTNDEAVGRCVGPTGW